MIVNVAFKGYIGNSLTKMNSNFEDRKKDVYYLVVERLPKFSGTQPEPDFSRSGMYPTLPKPDLLKQNIKFGVKSARYPTKYPNPTF